MAYWGYLGLFGDLRGLSGVIWGFGVDYLGLFGDLAWIIWGYFSHFLEFFGES